MAEEKTESAREQSQQAVIDIDDLDNLATPESILLRYLFSLFLVKWFKLSFGEAF